MRSRWVAVCLLLAICQLFQGCVFGKDYAASGPSRAGEAQDMSGDMPCVPLSDEELCRQEGIECGDAVVVDGCGEDRDLSCASICEPTDICFGNKCVCRSESDAEICEMLQAQCGTLNGLVDRCGEERDVNCGECVDPGQPFCDTDGVTNVCDCVERTCAQLEAQCGTLSDGCGVEIDCGECSNGLICDADYKCGQEACVPKSCMGEEKNCGLLNVGCEKREDCGECGDDESCIDNVCVCKPKTCDQLMAECGEVDDGCGEPLDCGDCLQDNFSCDENTNKCVCQPKTARQICRRSCEESIDLMDGCGNKVTLDCAEVCMMTGGTCMRLSSLNPLEKNCVRVNTP